MTGFRYQIDDQPIASGSQGAVHFAVRSDGLPVAVKIAASGRTAADAVRREIQLLRALNDVGIGGVVPCLDAMELGGRPALVMPRYPNHMGHWLHQVIQHPGPDTLADILDKIAGLAWSLGRVHEAPFEQGSLVHRDVKPENIFLDDEGEPWIGDFGGAMAIEGLEAVELALFGTPMWAPLDQILPGRAIPDPTWDTYALCVLLYAALTGARPAYQSDPRTLLTDAGTALWDAARRAVEAPPQDRGRWNRRFATMRTGTKASDLIDPTGHAALVDNDRLVLEQGLDHLCALAGVSDATRQHLLRGLWNLLTRGLSPLSHPSPPNRYRSGLELGETLDELRALLQDRRHSLSNLTPTPSASTARRRGPGLLLWTATGFLVGLGLIGTLAGGLLAFREPLRHELRTRGLLAPPERVVVGDGPAFALDATEVSVARYLACVAAGACPAVDQPLGPSGPASGLDRDAAAAFCQWAGGRLPTEAEWDRAAGSGPLPWGTGEITCAHAVGLGCSEEPLSVGSAPRGASPWGALDLAGNVWEWTADGVLKGGSVRSAASELGRDARRQNPTPWAGVRCAYPAP